jgi:hypothetical protein
VQEQEMSDDTTALEQLRAAYLSFVQADRLRVDSEAQARDRETYATAENRESSTRQRQAVKTRLEQEEQAEEERVAALLKGEKQAAAQREAELNRTSRERSEEQEKLKQQAVLRAEASRAWADERLRDTRQAWEDIRALVVKTLGHLVDLTDAAAKAATGNPELGLEQAAVTARQGVNEIKTGVQRLEAAIRAGRLRMMVFSVTMVIAVAVVGAVVAYQMPSKGKTARRLFNRYQVELNAAYGKNDMEALKKSYGAMLKEGEKSGTSLDDFTQGLSPVWYNGLLPGKLDGAHPGALKDFTYYGMIYSYLSQTMKLPETKGLVEECWQDSGKQTTKCRIDGKTYGLGQETILFSKDKKVLTGDVGETLTGTSSSIRFDGEDARIVQIIDSKDASLAVKKTEVNGTIKFVTMNINTLIRQGDGAMKDGDYGKALSLYKEVQQLVPDYKGLEKKIDKAGKDLKAQEIINQADADMQAGKLLEALAGYKKAQTIESSQSGLKEKIAIVHEMIRIDTLLTKADADMQAGKLQEALAGYREVQALNSKQAGLSEKIAVASEKIRNVEEKVAAEAKAAVEMRAAAEEMAAAEAKAAGVITDDHTKLEWIVGPNEDITYDQAVLWVAHCNVAGGGWRMPTRDELKSLYQKGVGNRNMNPAFKTTGWFVWAERKDSSSAWLFNFNRGDESWDGQPYRSDGYRVFGVRSRP